VREDGPPPRLRLAQGPQELNPALGKMRFKQRYFLTKGGK